MSAARARLVPRDRRHRLVNGWYPTAAARRLEGATMASEGPTLHGTIHARRMGTLRSACGYYVPEWPMDLTRPFDLNDDRACAACATILGIPHE